MYDIYVCEYVCMYIIHVFYHIRIIYLCSFGIISIEDWKQRKKRKERKKRKLEGGGERLRASQEWQNSKKLTWTFNNILFLSTLSS